MKKTLLFIGLAMCGSFAFAQSNNYNAKMDANNLQNVAISMRVSDMKPADYRSSIFAKDDADTLKVWHFNNGTDDMPTVYGVAGRVGAGEMVNGQALEVNTVTRKCATWQHVADTHSFINANDFASTYGSGAWGIQSIINVLGYAAEDLGDNGMMFMSMISFYRSDGFPNAYMQFAPVDRQGANVIIVAINQEYRKYYDQCWVDYKINGQWKTREVNVTGVDLDVNDWGTVHSEFAMPLELATQNNIEIRIRYSGTSRGNVYGYFWMIGDLAIINGSDDGWRRYGQDFVDGAYGTVPNGMQLPFTWLSHVANWGINPRTSVTAHANHVDAEGNISEVASNTMSGSFAAGDASVQYPVYIDERGFLNDNELDNAGYLLYAQNYGNPGLPSGCQGRGLPATTNGLNRVQVSATSPNADTLYWPYMPYRVVPNTNNPANPSLELGYRWGHDNGLIPTGRNFGASYVMGVSVVNGDQYIADSGNFGNAGYWMALRYTTPNTIPTTNGEPWRLLGIEIIPSTEVSADQLNNTRISLMAYRDVYDFTDSTVSMESVNTGVNGLIYTLSGEEISNELDLGYIKADADGDYNAVTVFFPEQPELLPNTSYRLGYQLQEDGLFAVAGTRNNTVMETEDGLAYVNFDSISAAGVTGYGRNFTPNTYDILLYDPVGTEVGSYWASYFSTQFPMIRAIVGPAREIPQHYLTMDCGQGQAIIDYNDEDVCGEEVQVAEGSSPVIYIFAGNDHRVLDKLYIDGVEIVPNTDDNLDGDPNFYTEGDDNIWDTTDDGFEYIALERNYWSYRFINLSEDHVIRVTSHEVEWNPVAVDPVAADVRMVLAPNPATSQVALALKGVTGMVNCNIIDMSGRVVYTSTLNAERQNTIDLSNVPAGAYFVRINNDSFVKVEKLIVR